MPNQTNRLAKKKDFTRVFKQGRSLYGKFLGVKVFSNQLAKSRYGIIISAKVSKKAVERNKLKRQISRIVNELDLSLLQPVDAAIVVLPEALGKTYVELEGEAERLFRGLKLIGR